MTSKLSIKKIILATFAVMVMKWRRLFEVSLIPFAFIALAMLTTKPFSAEDLLAINFTSFEILLMLLGAYINMTWALNVQRLTLLGNQSIPRLGNIIPNFRIGRYALLMLTLVAIIVAVLLAMQVVVALMPSLAVFIFFVANTLIFYALVKFSLKFPAIAVDVPSEALKIDLTKGNLPPLFTILVLLPITVVLVFSLLFGTNESPIILLLLNLLNLLVFYWTVISASLCYDYLKGINIEEADETV